jgi:hypothetical protein
MTGEVEHRTSKAGEAWVRATHGLKMVMVLAVLFVLVQIAPEAGE